MRNQGAGARRRWLLGISVAGSMLVPAAVAWACNPQAHINLNQTSFAPGSSITVYGSYFQGGKTVTVSGPTGSTSVTTSGGGAFTTTLTAPSAPGNYVISASKPTGGSAPASFSVVTPQAPSSPTTSQAVVPSTPSTGSGTSSPKFAVPTVHRSATPAPAHHAAPTPAAASPPASTSTPTAVAPTSVVAATPVASTPTVSAPVVANTTHRAAAGHAQTTVRSTAPATSQLAATSDLWNGFAPGRTASLTSSGAGGMGGGGTSSALTIGIGLLALGLIGLVAGLTVAELRRRRATV